MRSFRIFIVLAIMLTAFYSVTSGAASDQPVQNEKVMQSLGSSANLPKALEGVTGGESLLPRGVGPLSNIGSPPSAATENSSGKTKTKRLYPQPANVISGSVPSRAGYSWKTRIPFEIAQVDGFTGVFTAGKPIELSVKGDSPVDIQAVPNEGFSLTTTIFDQSRSTIFGAGHGVYDEEKQAWQVNITAPDDVTKSYEIEIFLYCAIDESRCAEIYGRAAQTSKTLQFQLQSE